MVVPYDPAWPASYEEERRRLARVFPDAAIEHVGSTAVLGLGGKPILDIMVGVLDLREVEERIRAVEGLGYRYVPEYEASLPGRRYFRKPRARPSTHHLHCVSRESAFWERHLRFRDHLRSNPGDARRYEALKRRLAAVHGSDRVGYTEAKGRFIEEVLRRSAEADGGLRRAATRSGVRPPPRTSEGT